MLMMQWKVFTASWRLTIRNRSTLGAFPFIISHSHERGFLHRCSDYAPVRTSSPSHPQALGAYMWHRSDEMVSMNAMADMAMDIAGKLGCKGKMPINHIPGPEGVRGRNSNNDLIKQVLGWAPSISLREGLEKTAPWILDRINEKKAAGQAEDYSSSKVVGTQAATKVGDLRGAD
jgi:nucleoside-diphosphate-sugar epimerase